MALLCPHSYPEITRDVDDLSTGLDEIEHAAMELRCVTLLPMAVSYRDNGEEFSYSTPRSSGHTRASVKPRPVHYAKILYAHHPDGVTCKCGVKATLRAAVALTTSSLVAGLDSTAKIARLSRRRRR